MPQAQRKLKGAVSLLMCTAKPSPDAFSAIKLALKTSAEFLGMAEGEHLLVPDFREKGAVRNMDALVRAERLGCNLARGFRYDDRS